MKMGWLAITLSYTDSITWSFHIYSSSLCFTLTICSIVSSSFFHANNRTAANEPLDCPHCAASYTNLSVCVIHNIINLWAGLSCSSIALDIVGVCTGNNFFSLLNFSAGRIGWFCTFRNGLKYASLIVRFCIRRKCLMPCFLKTWVLRPGNLESFFDQENCQICLGIT